MSHVKSVHLGRRNFHYLLSSLALEDDWGAEHADQYGAVNVTGLRLFRGDGDGEAKEFLARWREKSGAQAGTAAAPVLPAGAPLAYDAVSVLAAAFAALARDQPGFIRQQQARYGGGAAAGKRKGEVLLISAKKVPTLRHDYCAYSVWQTVEKVS